MHFLLASGDWFPVSAAATPSFGLDETASVAALGMAETSADAAGTRLQSTFEMLCITVGSIGLTIASVPIVLQRGKRNVRR